MRLSNLRTPTRGYAHFLGKRNLPPKITEDKIKDLLPLIRSQWQPAIDEAICGHMRLAMEIVGRYLFALKSDRWVDDLVGAALLGLCQGVTWVSEGRLKDDGLSGYLVSTIHRFISDCIDHSPLVRIPQRTLDYHRQIGKSEAKMPKTVSIDGIVDFDRAYNRGAFKRRALFGMECEPSVESDCKITDLREIISKIAMSDTHRKILELREAGHKDAEISEQLSLSSTTIWLMRQEMQQRYLEITDELE